MPSILVQLSEDHVRALVQRQTLGAQPLALDAVGSLPGMQQQSPIYQSYALSLFVLRCIGTALELEAHQTRGGRLLLEHEHGEVQELKIDLSQDGTNIPRVVLVSRSGPGGRRGPAREEES
jgi:hypothetical protein